MDYIKGKTCRIIFFLHTSSYKLSFNVVKTKIYELLNKRLADGVQVGIVNKNQYKKKSPSLGKYRQTVM